MTRYIILLAILTGSLPVHAFDLDLLKNDKEEVSRYLQHHGGTRNGSLASPMVQQAFQAFGEALDSSLRMHSSSSVDLIRQLQVRLKSANLPQDTASRTSYFREWRQLGWIDDLLLEILEQNNQLTDLLDQSIIPRLSSRTRMASSRFAVRLALSDEVLAGILAPLKGCSPANPGSSLDLWPGIAARLGELASHPDGIRHLINHAHLLGILGPSEFALSDALRLHRPEEWPLRLGPYLRMLRSFKNNQLPRDPSPEERTPNPFSSQTVFRRDPLTWRKALYTRFSPLQANLLVSLMKRFFERMDADQAALVFSSRSGPFTDSIPLSPMGQYYFARKLLLKDMQDLNRSVLFRESPFVFEDLLSASLESGLIHAGILNQVYQIDDLWNPEVRPWSKVAGYALQATGNAAVFLPPPFNVISSVALILIESRMERHSRGKTRQDPGYDPF